MKTRLICAVVSVVLASGCAGLEQLRQLVQAPKFEQAPGRRAEIRLVGPRSDLPIGGAAVRLWTRVSNPNAFGLTLGTLRGSLYLQGSHAADADFPLGLPLRAGEETEIPIDLSISFSDLPGLADAVRRAVDRQPLPYRFEGTIGVDAGRLGTPVFGPMTLMTGEIQPVR